MIPLDLTPLMCDLLVEHVDGSAPIVRRDFMRMRSLRSLEKRGLVRVHRQERVAHETWLTEKGRRVLSAVLAHYADALARAGMLDPKALRPLAVAPHNRFRASVPITRQDHETTEAVA